MQLILGYGNTLRGDDGFGAAVVACLQKINPNMPSVELICGRQLLPEHAEALARASLAIFVDASNECEPGQIACIALKPDGGSKLGTAQVLLPHSLSPLTLLALANVVYGCAPQAFVYTVGAASFDLGETLSPLVETAVPQVAEMILSRLELSVKNT